LPILPRFSSHHPRLKELASLFADRQERLARQGFVYCLLGSLVSLSKSQSDQRCDSGRLESAIAQHNHYADRSRKHLFPLTGFMRCGHCGSMISGQVQKGHLYYNCSHRRDPKCPDRKYARSELIEEQVIAFLSQVQLPAKFKTVLDAYFQHFAKERLDQEENERKSPSTRSLTIWRGLFLSCFSEDLFIA
jgi:hypothetical protein